MKILIVNTFYYPNMQGGAEQSVKLLAENLVKRGHEVGIFCIDSKESKPSIEKYNGVKVFRHDSGNFNLYGFSYDKKGLSKAEKIKQKLICYYNKKTLKCFDEFLDKFKPDVIHTNSTYGMSTLIWKTAHSKNIPVVHTIRDTAIISPFTYGHKDNKAVVKMHRTYVKYTSQFVSGVTSPSNYTLSTSLINNNFKNAVVKKCIFNSVQIDNDRLSEIIEIKKQRNSDFFKFFFAGRLVEIKGIVHLIESFNQLDMENTELHICGGGALLDYVKKESEKNSRIIVHGKLDNEQLGKVYDECDVAVVPSMWPEPFGRVVIEANMHALPVIVSDCGGMPEIISNTKAGTVYKNGNNSELARVMKEYCNRDKIKSSFENIKNNIGIYSIERQIDSFEDVYQILINKVKKNEKV